MLGVIDAVGVRLLCGHLHSAENEKTQKQRLGHSRICEKCTARKKGSMELPLVSMLTAALELNAGRELQLTRVGVAVYSITAIEILIATIDGKGSAAAKARVDVIEDVIGIHAE